MIFCEHCFHDEEIKSIIQAISPSHTGECPICHSKNIRYYTRIIGYLTAVDNWSIDRQKEFENRVKIVTGIYEADVTKKEEPVVAEPVITEVPTTEPIKEEIKEEEPAYKSEVTIKQEETPTEVQTENTVEPVIEPVIEPVVETVKEEPVVPVTEELPEIELPKINENKESDDISKLINSNDEPIVLTDASISELPTEEVKTEESELEQTKTLVDLRNRLNNIRQK